MEPSKGAVAAAPAGTPPPLWRKQFYVHKIQTTYALWIGVFLFIYSLLIFGLAFLTPYILPALKLVSNAPIEERAQAAQHFLSLSATLGPALGPAMIGLIIFSAFLSIYLTHRLAGPLYRIEKSAKEMAEGNLALRIRLREKDELQELAETLNQVAQNLDQTLQKIGEHDAAAQGALSRLTNTLKASPSSNSEMREQLQIAQAESEKIKEVLNRFRLSVPRS